jgi:hypothetical protein
MYLNVKYDLDYYSTIHYCRLFGCASDRFQNGATVATLNAGPAKPGGGIAQASRTRLCIFYESLGNGANRTVRPRRNRTSRLQTGVQWWCQSKGKFRFLHCWYGKINTSILLMAKMIIINIEISFITSRTTPSFINDTSTRLSKYPHL